MAEKDPEHTTGLRRHIPDLAIEWMLDTPDDLWRQFEGTLCFADISGFTALAERLAQRGRMGGEELVETLGRVFAQMLDIADARGGSLLKFGGDALLLFFRGEDHAVQAACAAVEMRQALRRASEMATSVGPLRLTMSVGLHSGTVDFFLVGGPHRELILLGPSADEVVETENSANAREIVVSTSTASLLPTAATKERDDGALLLRWRKAATPACGHRADADCPDEIVQSLFPGELGLHLAPGVPDPEHRIACIAFARFSGTHALLDGQGPHAVAEALQTTVAGVQEVLVEEGVTLLAIDVDQDGGKFFLGAGVPNAHEDDEGVMLRAMRRIIDLDLPLPLQVGVNRGHVFAAEVGGSRRAAYSAMGDTTNTAARIASKAPHGSIYAHPAVLDECLTRFAVEPAGPLTMKGKAAPQMVYDVGEILGIREREGLDVDVFVGRHNELSTLREAIEALDRWQGGVITIVGETGLGKSRLLREAIHTFDQDRVMSLRAEPYGASSPYRMLRDPIRDLLDIERGDVDSMASALERSVRSAASELMPMVSLIGEVVQIPIEPSEEVLAIDTRFRPARTSDALIRLMDRRRPGPLIITVDEAHWCDEASAQLLERLAAAAKERPWLMLVARRDAEVGFRPDASKLLPIEPMPDEDIRALVQMTTDAAPLRAHELEAVVRRAGGYPLFAEEIVRALREMGSLDAVPESLEAAMAAQVDALDSTARRVLQFASVLGRSFSEDVVEQLLAAEGRHLDKTLLQRLENFLIPEDENGTRFRFRSGMLRDTIYERVAYRLRARLHLQAGEAMEHRAEDPNIVADALSLHFSQAGDHARTWRYARIAGDRARDNYANADAVLFYELALGSSRKVPNLTQADVIKLLVELGHAQELLGLLDDALQAFRKALKLVGDDPVERAELLLRRARAKERACEFSSALRDLTTGKKLLQRAPQAKSANKTLARIQAIIAMVFEGQDRPAKAVAAAEIARQLAEEAGEHEAEYWALNVLETASMEAYGPGDGKYLERALAIADDHLELRFQAVVRDNLGVYGVYACQWDKAVEWLESAREIYAKVGNTLNDAYAAATIGEIYVNQRRFAEAEVILKEALRTMQSLGFDEGVATINLQLARIMIEHHAFDEAEALMDQVADTFDEMGEPRFVLEATILRCDALRGAGRAELALEVLDDCMHSTHDVGFLQAKAAYTRSLILADLNRFDDALAEVEGGIKAAKQLRLPFDEALLFKARAEILAANGNPLSADAAAESERLLAGLGVLITPSPA